LPGDRIVLVTARSGSRYERWKFRRNYEYFYQKLSLPPEKLRTTPRLKSTGLHRSVVRGFSGKPPSL